MSYKNPLYQYYSKEAFLDYGDSTPEQNPSTRGFGHQRDRGRSYRQDHYRRFGEHASDQDEGN